MIYTKPSTKVPGYRQFKFNDTIVHILTPEAKDYCCSYWDAEEIAEKYSDLHLPTISQAKKLIASDVIKELDPSVFIVGPLSGPWLRCWTCDGGAIEYNPTQKDYTFHNNASETGQLAPIWFIEEI